MLPLRLLFTKTTVLPLDTRLLERENRRRPRPLQLLLLPQRRTHLPYRKTRPLSPRSPSPAPVRRYPTAPRVRVLPTILPAVAPGCPQPAKSSAWFSP